VSGPKVTSPPISSVTTTAPALTVVNGHRLPPLPEFTPADEKALRDAIRRPNLTKPGAPCPVPCGSETPCEWFAFPEDPTEWTRVHTQVIGRPEHAGFEVHVETHEYRRDGSNNTWWDGSEIWLKGKEIVFGEQDAITVAELVIRAASACTGPSKGA